MRSMLLDVTMLQGHRLESPTKQWQSACPCNNYPKRLVCPRQSVMVSDETQTLHFEPIRHVPTVASHAVCQAEVLDVFLRRTAAVSLSGYLFFGSSVDIGSKAVQAGGCPFPVCAGLHGAITQRGCPHLSSIID